MTDPELLGDLVHAACHAAEGEEMHTAFACRRRPKRRACTGHLIVTPSFAAARIEYRCSVCDGETGYVDEIRGLAERARSWVEFRPQVAERGVDLEIDRADFRRVCELEELEPAARELWLAARTEGERIHLRLAPVEGSALAGYLLDALGFEESPARADAALRVVQALEEAGCEPLLFEGEEAEFETGAEESPATLDDLLELAFADDTALARMLATRSSRAWQEELAARLETGVVAPGDEIPLAALLHEVGVEHVRSRLSALLTDPDAPPAIRGIVLPMLSGEGHDRFERLVEELGEEEAGRIAEAAAEALVGSEPEIAASLLPEMFGAVSPDAREEVLERWDALRRSQGLPAHELLGPLACSDDAEVRALALERIVEEGSEAARRFLERARNETADARVRRDLQTAYLRVGAAAADSRPAEGIPGQAWITPCDGSGAFTVLVHLRPGTRSECIASLCARVTGELRDGFVIPRASKQRMQAILAHFEGNAELAPVPVPLTTAAGVVRTARSSGDEGFQPVPPEVEQALARIETIPAEELPPLPPAPAPRVGELRALLETAQYDSWFFDEGDLREVGLGEIEETLEPDEISRRFDTDSFRRRLLGMTAYMARYHDLADEWRESSWMAGLHQELGGGLAGSPLPPLLLERGLEILSQSGPLEIGYTLQRRDLRRSLFGDVEHPTGRDLALLDLTEAAHAALDRVAGSLPQDRRPRNEERALLARDTALTFYDAHSGGALEDIQALIAERLRLAPPEAKRVAALLLVSLDIFVRNVCAGCPIGCLERPDERFDGDFFSDAHPAREALATEAARAQSGRSGATGKQRRGRKGSRKNRRENRGG